MPWPALSTSNNYPTWEWYPQTGADAQGWVTFTVSTETPLLPLIDFGIYADVRGELLNNSGNLVVLYGDKSGDGIKVSGIRDTVSVAASQYEPLERLNHSDLYLGFSAAGDPNAGNPSSAVKFRVLVRKRPPWR